VHPSVDVSYLYQEDAAADSDFFLNFETERGTELSLVGFQERFCARIAGNEEILSVDTIFRGLNTNDEMVQNPAMEMLKEYILQYPTTIAQYHSLVQLMKSCCLPENVASVQLLPLSLRVLREQDQETSDDSASSGTDENRKRQKSSSGAFPHSNNFTLQQVLSYSMLKLLH